MMRMRKKECSQPEMAGNSNEDEEVGVQPEGCRRVGGGYQWWYWEGEGRIKE